MRHQDTTAAIEQIITGSYAGVLKLPMDQVITLNYGDLVERKIHSGVSSKASFFAAALLRLWVNTDAIDNPMMA
jgi:hypothetical protein